MKTYTKSETKTLQVNYSIKYFCHEFLIHKRFMDSYFSLFFCVRNEAEICFLFVLSWKIACSCKTVCIINTKIYSGMVNLWNYSSCLSLMFLKATNILNIFIFKCSWTYINVQICAFTQTQTWPTQNKSF